MAQQYYYHWWFDRDEKEWLCTITPKDYFDSEGCLSDRGGILDNETHERLGLMELMESEFQRNDDSPLSVTDIKELMNDDPNFIDSETFSAFVEECYREERCDGYEDDED